MNKLFRILFTLILGSFMLFQCAEKKEVLEVGTHPDGWSDPESPQFHGKAVLESPSTTQNCATCHGKDYGGGTSAVTCSGSGCHEQYPHKAGFTDPASSNFHGKFVAEFLGFNLLTCQPCHGASFRGEGVAEKNCFRSGCHALYPHDDEYAVTTSAEFHGKFIADSLEWNIRSCQSCHGTDYRGESYSQKNCLSCHDQYPHKAGFAGRESDEFHGTFLADSLNWNLSTCKGCHGEDYKGKGYNNKNCLSCHRLYPHMDGFALTSSANFHGDYINSALSGDVESCKNCHGEDYKGAGYLKKNCMNCHELYPHSQDYAIKGSARFHGTYIAETLEWDMNSCRSCHGAAYDGDGDADKNCYTCHSQFPHTADISNQASDDFHGTVIAEQLSWDMTSCRSCHGDDYSGNDYQNKNCRTCHTTYPHDVEYTNPSSADFHGIYIAETLSFDMSSCQSCHGENFGGEGYDRKNCRTCHDLYPHIQGYISKSSANFHGTYVAETLEWDMTSCQSCHGNDFSGNGYTEKNCRSCHATYPHQTGFATEDSENFHGEYIEETLDYNLTSCRSCHGQDLGGNGYEEKNCRTCHDIYPHDDAFSSEASDAFHGKYIAETLSWEMASCQDCHGSDFSGDGAEEKNCRTCHTTYPHRSGFSNEESDTFHGNYVETTLGYDMTSCKSCHGTDYGGNGYVEKNCRTCHALYPHTSGFDVKGSVNFHGTYIAETLDYDMTSCRSCHGADFAGEGVAQKNCRNCHATYPHQTGFANEDSDNFHGEYIEETLDYNLTSCQSCHGEDLGGNGSEKKNCRTCHDIYPHDDAFSSEASDAFHGKYIAETLSWEMASCQDCHGDDFSGDGVEQKNCRTCHTYYPHAEGFTDDQSGEFHGQFVSLNLAWDITDCRTCHGNDYAGQGYEEKNCTTCHTEQQGPEACSTCHGTGEAGGPPPDLLGNTSTTGIGVGAHAAHLSESRWTTAYELNCALCHVVPEYYGDEGHVKDGTPHAEVVFGPFATNDGTLGTAWDRGNASCTNVYCHGAFEFLKAGSSYQFMYTGDAITGSNPEMRWDDVGSGQANCGTCHTLPPAGHTAQTSCNTCHTDVVGAGNNIIDKTLHINRQKNVF